MIFYVYVGLSGNETAIQFGGLPYVMPFGIKEKVYDMKDIMKITGSDPLFVVGAGAGPWPYAHICSEVILIIIIILLRRSQFFFYLNVDVIAAQY